MTRKFVKRSIFFRLFYYISTYRYHSRCQNNDAAHRTAPTPGNLKFECGAALRVKVGYNLFQMFQIMGKIGERKFVKRAMFVWMNSNGFFSA